MLLEDVASDRFKIQRIDWIAIFKRKSVSMNGGGGRLLSKYDAAVLGMNGQNLKKT